MNKALQEKLRKLTMYYNSHDFLAEKPGAEETDTAKLITKLEGLFFEKDKPMSTADIMLGLYGETDDYEKKLSALEAEIAKIEGMSAIEKGIALAGGLDVDKRSRQLSKDLDKLNAMSGISICSIIGGSVIFEEGQVHESLGVCFEDTKITDIVLNRDLAAPPRDMSEGRFGDTPNKLNTSVLFAQIHSNVTSPNRRNASVLESYINYIPNIERSKCVPDLQVRFLTKQNVKDSENMEELAVLNFLNGPGQPKEGSADHLLIKASKNDIESGLSRHRSTTTHGMEMFTMPQTLQGHISDSNPLGDPFRPLMSLDGASIDIYAAGQGFISYKKATLDFTLFDRTRLKDISFLLDPSRYGNTIIEIDAGWTHPDDSSPYGAILSAMRIKDTYQITKSNFSMKGSSTFNVKVDVAMLGGSDIFNKNVFSVGSNSHTKTMRDLAADRRELLSDYQTLSNMLAGVNARDGGRLLPESIVRRRGDDESVIELTSDAISRVNMGITELSTLTSGTGRLEGIDISDDQLETLGDIGYVLTNNNPITQYSTLMENSITALTAQINATDSTDPFLLDGFASDKYISFGKLFFNLCVLPIIDSTTTDHTHIIMYNFNKYAARKGYVGAQSGDGEKHNLSTFAFEKTKVINKLKKHLETKYFIAPQDVIAFARATMAAQLNENYGIVPAGSQLEVLREDHISATDRLSTNRNNLSELTPTPPTTGSSPHYFPLAAEISASPSSFPSTQKSYETRRDELTNAISADEAATNTIGEQIEQGLEEAQEKLLSDMGTSKIKMPSLQLFVETVNTNRNQAIVRLHVYDSKEAPYELHEIAANMGIISDGTSLDDNEQTAHLFEDLVAGNFIIDVPGNDRVPAHKALNIRNLALKKAIKNNMPSITYGTEATAINSISLSTISDSNVNTHFLLETRQKEEKDEESPDSSPEPLETLQSAKDAQKIFPITMTIDMLGCPVIDYAQQMFIDLGTGTDLDNVYAAIDVTHKLKPGSFKTTVKMSPTFSGETVTFSDMISDIIAAQARLEKQMGD